MSGLLIDLQQHLSKIYDLPEGADVSRFLINFETLQKFLPDRRLDPELHEQVVLKCNPDASIDLGLYFHTGVLENLQKHRPDISLDERNWSDFCAVVEGISHFLFLDFRSQQALPVSPLELELQAEIDKFITSFVYKFRPEDGPEILVRQVHGLLFHNFEIRRDLPAEERERYDIASSAAAKFCLLLSRRFLFVRPDWSGLFRFLREFYRLGQEAKFAAIAAAA